MKFFSRFKQLIAMKNSYGGLVKKKLEMCKYGVDCIHPYNCKYCHSNRELEEAKEASQKDGLNRNRKIHMCSHIMANRACPMKTAKECAFSHSVKEQEDALAREASQKDGLNRNRKIYMCKHIQANRACPMNVLWVVRAILFHIHLTYVEDMHTCAIYLTFLRCFPLKMLN